MRILSIEHQNVNMPEYQPYQIYHPIILEDLKGIYVLKSFRISLVYSLIYEIIDLYRMREKI